MRKKKTERGMFIPDASGVSHYESKERGTVFQAIRDALKHCRRPAWFWFNGTPCPIGKRDTANKLFDRWCEWRTAYQTDAKSFLEKMVKFAGID